MLAHGDEMGRTQHGNNNVYCQDSPLAWMDWSLMHQNSDLLEFTRNVIALRTEHPIFRRRRFLDGRPVRSRDRAPDIAWLTPEGTEMTTADWDSGFGKSLTVFLNGKGIHEPDPRGARIRDDSFLLCFNAHDDAMEFTLPNSDYGTSWTVALDSSTPTGLADADYPAAAPVAVASRCLLVLRHNG